jgi:hypothetical protein
MVGLDTLLEEVHVAQELTGFRAYLTNTDLTALNSFVRDHSQWNDTTPPQWTSTYNPHEMDAAGMPQEPPPRVGIQQAVPVPGGVTVRWDVALDLNRVGYALYYQTTPFDFTADPTLGHAVRTVLTPALPRSYGQGVGPGVYPFEATVTSLLPGTMYYFVIRAFDQSPAHNEEHNQTVLTAVPAAR